MSLDHALREMISGVVREVVRDEIRAALRECAAPAAPASEEGDYLTVARAAALVGVHPSTVRAWMKAGALAPYRAGRVVRVRRSELQASLARTEGAPSRDELKERAAVIVARSLARSA